MLFCKTNYVELRRIILIDNKVDSFLRNLISDGVPKETQKMVMGLSRWGKQALVNIYDKNSDFAKHAAIEENVHRFAVDTSKHLKIYHYTKVGSLIKILSSGSFLISSSTLMNDPDEFKWANKIGKEYLRKTGANESEVAAFQEMIDLQPFKDSYIWSFTKNDDSLTLYNVYGLNEQNIKEGVALEFDLNTVMHTLASQNANGKNSLDEFEDGDAYTFPIQVQYDENLQKEYVNPIVEEWLYAYRSCMDDPNDMHEIMVLCAKAMYLFNIAFKNPDLCHEEELRFVTVKIGDNVNKLNASYSPRIRCKITKEFILSAKLQTGNYYSVADLKEILAKYGYNNVQVEQSRLPY